MSTPLWQPPRQRAEDAQVTRFAARLARETGLPLGDYAALHRFSVDEPERFWPALWDELGMIAEGSVSPALVPGPSLEAARFFPNIRLSFAENLLRGDDDALALVARTSAGARRTLTFRELRAHAASVAAFLRARAVGPGDRIAAILPNGPEAVIAMLAANSLGAIWSLCAPDLGHEALLDRFGQIAPRVLFTLAAGSPKADPLRRVRKLTEKLSSVEHVVVLGASADDLEGSDVPFATLWDDVVHTPAPPLTFARLPFDHPSFILYTSGTTGLPKCIVHGMGGMLLQLLKEHRMHYDLRPGERFFYQTSTGWNMWYWNVIALAAGATLVIREGSPFEPRPTALFDLADEERISVFGISPPYLATLREGGVIPKDLCRLGSIKTILSTGSPLSPELFDWVYENVKADMCLSSISGGTEINACFGTGNPALPVHRGELQCKALGMKVEVFDDAGKPVEGELGELVATAPFPSQPVGFWNDPDGARYRATYFERFHGAWHHGDLCRTTAHGGLVIEGRSDATLKPSGHRIGTAEIYRQVERLAEVVDAVAIGQKWQGDVRIVLFVQLRPGLALTAELEARIRGELARNAGPFHVPARIVAVTDIPRTASGKKAELAVRAAVEGEPIKNLSALSNPEALGQYRGLPALQT
ncbi:MAG: acetoacetate--CoA ligase [Byssovorax sp.]